MYGLICAGAYTGDCIMLAGIAQAFGRAAALLRGTTKIFLLGQNPNMPTRLMQGVHFGSLSSQAANGPAIQAAQQAQRPASNVPG